MTDCPLCQDGVDDVEVLAVTINTTPEGERPNYVDIKRALEAEFDVDLTVRLTKQHVGKAAHRTKRADQMARRGRSQ